MSLRYNDKNGVETLLSGLTQGDNTAIPDGGDTNQVLAKNSTTDRDLKWATTETLIKKGQNNGVASLGADGKVPLGQIPEIPETNNLIPYPYTHLNGRTSNGIVWTVNADGSVNAKGTIGTAAATSGFNFCTRPNSIGPGPILEKGKTYTLTGCPAGGSTTTYKMQLVYNTSVDGSTYNSVSDYGNGVTFTVADTYVGQPITVQAYLFVSGNTYDVTFYPMLVEGEVAQPYVNPIDESDTIVKRMYEIEEQAAINLIPFPYDRPLVYSSNGITWIVNDDGSITANGTATADSNYACELLTSVPGFKIEDIGYYTVSGCPEGGWYDTYLVWIAELPDSGTGSTVLGRDYGKGASFYIAEANLNRRKQVVCTVKKDQTVTNLTFKPMLTKGALPIEYKSTTENIKNRIGILEEKTAKNLLPYPYYRPNTFVTNGITYTVNSDGSVTANGTATGANANFYLTDWRQGVKHIESGKTYTLSGCPSGGTTNTYSLICYTFNESGAEPSPMKHFFDIGNGATVNVPEGYEYIRIYIRVVNGTTVNNLTFKPMLEEGFVAHDYKPTTEDTENRLNFVENNSTKNLIPFPYDFATGAENRGVTYTINKDGSITSVGTVTHTSGSYANVIATDRTRIFLPSGSYTLSAHSKSARTGAMLYFWNVNDTTQKYSGTSQGLSTDDSNTYLVTSESGTVSDLGNGINHTKHFTLGSDAYVTCAVRTIRSTELDATVNETLHFMLEKGFVEHDYVPTVSEVEYNNYYNKLNITGGTLTGDLKIAPTNHNGDIYVGQNTVNGYEGFIHIYGKDATDATTNVNRKVALKAGSKLTADRAFTFPNASGEIEVRQVNNAAVKLTTTDVARKTFTFTDSKITSQNCYYYKIDHRVVVYVSIEASAALTTNLTYTIPAGYRPLNTTYAVDIHTLQSSTSHPVLTVGTDGVVTVLPVNQTSINITVEYDAWN